MPVETSVVLSADELEALPVHSVVDATVATFRVRAVRLSVHAWMISEQLAGNSFAATIELEDAVLVADSPITPSPVKPLPLPTTPGDRFWGKSDGSEPQYWFIQSASSGTLWYIPTQSHIDEVRDIDVTRRGLVCLVDPNTTKE